MKQQERLTMVDNIDQEGKTEELLPLKGKALIFFNHYTNAKNPKTFMCGSEAARKAGYKDGDGLNRVAYTIVQKIKPHLQEWLNVNGFTDEAIQSRVLEGFDAHETKFFQKDGKVTDTRDVIDWETRRKYLELAAKMLGMYAPEKVKVGADETLQEILKRIAGTATKLPSQDGESFE